MAAAYTTCIVSDDPKHAAALARWTKQDEEWHEIAQEMVAKRPGQPITPYQVTVEQRKRMLARGERPFSMDELGETGIRSLEVPTMKRCILTDNDLSTITNALRGAAEMCRKDAANAPDTPEGKHLAAAVSESARQYEDLAVRIAEADEITVDP